MNISAVKLVSAGMFKDQNLLTDPVRLRELVYEKKL